MELLRNPSTLGHNLSVIPSRFAPGRIWETVTGLYAALLAALLPLLLHHGYFDITETKLIVFLSLTGAYLLTLAVLFCLPRTREQLHVLRFSSFGAADACFLLFTVSSLAGALFFDAPDIFIAHDNRYQGILSLAAYAAVWFSVTRLLQPTRAQAILPLAAFALICLLAALQRCGLDPFSLRAGLIPMDRGRFISTLGNIDFYGSYLCLVLPALPYLLCRAEQTAARWLFSALLLLGVFGVVSSGGDGAAVALTASFLITPLLLRGKAREARRLLLIDLAMLLAAHGFAAFASQTGSGYYFSNLTRLMLHPAVSAALAALCLLGFLLLRRCKPDRVYRAYRLALLLLAAFAFLAVVLLSTVFTELPLGRFARFLRFNAEWGTDRGKIWRFCLETYRAMPLSMQIFGGGPGYLLMADMRAPLFSDALVDTAHCEYLQYLITTGALGLSAYLGLLGSVAGRALRRRSFASDALLLAVVSYAIQASAGIAQPETTPLFFLLLAVLHTLTKKTGIIVPASECSSSVTSSTIPEAPTTADSPDTPSEAL